MDVPAFVRLLKRQNMNSEVWWDSSPTLYSVFRNHMLQHYPGMSGFISNLLPETFTHAPNGLSGVTTNPGLIAQAVLDAPGRWHEFLGALPKSLSAFDKARQVYDQMVQDGARQLLPLWRDSQQRHGWLSAQIEGGERMTESRLVERGLQLASLAPNIMVKVPGSEHGYRAIERLVAKGCSINNTFCFTVSQAAACLKAIQRGRLRAQVNGVDTEHAHYVISFMIGRFGAEEEFARQAAQRRLGLSPVDRRWAELAVYQAIQALLRRSQTSTRLLLCSLKIDTDTQGREQCWHLQRTGFDTTLYTMTPQIIGFLIRRQQQNLPIKPATDWVQVPNALMSRLTAIPYFNQAYFEGDLLPSRFVHHPAFVTASLNARAGVERLQAFVKGASGAGDRLPVLFPELRAMERAS